MLHSRIRPLPRRHQRQDLSSPSTAPPPDLRDEDEADLDQPEDLFSTFLPHLFPDDTPSFHGDPGQRLLYTSPRYGDLEIMVPSYPGQSEKRTEEIAAGVVVEGKRNEVDEKRKLFAHFLWSAAMVVAEGVERDDEDDDDADTGVDTDREDRGMWRVKGERVLELGAG